MVENHSVDRGVSVAFHCSGGRHISPTRASPLTPLRPHDQLGTLRPPHYLARPPRQPWTRMYLFCCIRFLYFWYMFVYNSIFFQYFRVTNRQNSPWKLSLTFAHVHVKFVIFSTAHHFFTLFTPRKYVIGSALRSQTTNLVSSVS